MQTCLRRCANVQRWSSYDDCLVNMASRILQVLSQNGKGGGVVTPRASSIACQHAALPLRLSVPSSFILTCTMAFLSSPSAFPFTRHCTPHWLSKYSWRTFSLGLSNVSAGPPSMHECAYAHIHTGTQRPLRRYMANVVQVSPTLSLVSSPGSKVPPQIIILRVVATLERGCGGQRGKRRRTWAQ